MKLTIKEQETLQELVTAAPTVLGLIKESWIKHRQDYEDDYGKDEPMPLTAIIERAEHDLNMYYDTIGEWFDHLREKLADQ